MAAPVLESVGAGVFHYGSGGSPLAVPYPSGIEENDYLLMGVWARNYPNVTTPTDWEQIQYLIGSNIRWWLFGGFAVGTETGNLSLVFSGTPTPIVAAMARFSGVHLTRPYEGFVGDTMGSSTVIDIPATEALYTDRLCVSWLSSNTFVTLADDATNYSEQIDYAYNGTQDGSVGMYTYAGVSQGAVAADTVTASASCYNSACALALRPLAAVEEKYEVKGVELVNAKTIAGVDPANARNISGR